MKAGSSPHVGEQPQHKNPEEYQILQQQQNSPEQQATRLEKYSNQIYLKLAAQMIQK